eukprot:SAG11_NODE_13406_length_656_cov_1.581688_1_plen_47_part_10
MNIFDFVVLLICTWSLLQSNENAAGSGVQTLRLLRLLRLLKLIANNP